MLAFQPELFKCTGTLPGGERVKIAAGIQPIQRSARLGLWLALFTAAVTAPGELVVLENSFMRLELDPQTFSVRFAGTPGGKNFLEPVHLTESEVAGSGWVEPGGYTVDVLPESDNSALLRRGPATVEARESGYVLLLGPEDPVSQWRVKKEFYLDRDAPDVRVKITLLSSQKEERRAGIRLTAQVVRDGTLEYPHESGAPGLLAGDFPNLSAIRDQAGSAYMISIPGAGRQRALLSARANAVTVVTSYGRWTRTLELLSAGETGEEAGNPRLLALLDDDTHICQVAMELCQSGVNVGAPLVAVERWTFSR